MQFFFHNFIPVYKFICELYKFGVLFLVLEYYFNFIFFS